MKKLLSSLVLSVSLWAGASVVVEGRQGFNAQIQAALNALGYVTSSATVVQWSKSFLMAASSYINFGATSGVNGYGIRDSAGTMQYKNSGGSWVSLPSGGGAPVDATYITQTANSTLTNEQALSSLATGFVLNTTGTGVLSVWAGSGCTNSFFTNIASNGTVTCGAQPGTPGVQDWGASGFGWKDIYFSGGSGTPTNNDFKITGTSTGGHRTITFPDASITVQSTTGTPAGFVIASQATSDILVASSASAWARVPTANSSMFVTNGSGVPSWTTTLPTTLGFGAATDVRIAYMMNPTFTASTTGGRTLSVRGSITLPANGVGYGLEVAPTLITPATGTNAVLASVYVDRPTVTAGGSTITETSVLYVETPASAGAANYSLHVLGLTRLDGLASVSGFNYVCSNTLGVLSKNNTACVGTDAEAIAMIPQLLTRIESLERQLSMVRR